MIYRVLYNTHEVGCLIHDRQTALDFVRYMTTQDKYPVAIIKIKIK